VFVPGSSSEPFACSAVPRACSGLLSPLTVCSHLQNGGDGAEGSDPTAHPLLRRSQSYIPTSATKPPTGPPAIKSGFCVKQGNVVSAGWLWVVPSGWGCSGCLQGIPGVGRVWSPTPSGPLCFPEEELEAPLLCPR